MTRHNLPSCLTRVLGPVLRKRTRDGCLLVLWLNASSGRAPTRQARRRLHGAPAADASIGGMAAALDRTLADLQHIGFSQYEARAYIGLLQTSPITGYELAKRSGIPRSMIYETVGKLLDRGAAYTVPSDPITYAPVPVTELVARLRRGATETFDSLESALASLDRAPEVDVIHHVRGDDRIVAEMEGLIDRTTSQLWLSLWGAQVRLLAPAVARAEERGAKVFSVIFGGAEASLGRTFHHGYMRPEVVQKRLGGHLSITARDGAEVVIAEFIEPAGSWAVKTHDPALVLIATDYIRHDIMFDVLIPELGVGRLDEIWQSDPDLVQVVTGQVHGSDAD